MSGNGFVLNKLREIMKTPSYVVQPLGAYIIPHNDAHQSEYLAACDKRRDFISGFTGSMGTAVVTQNAAALWTDGRYFLQAQQELSSNWILMKDNVYGTPSIEDWLCDVLPEGSRVGADPVLLSFNLWKTISFALESNGFSLVPIEKNLIDVIWEKKPPLPTAPIFNLPVAYAGEPWHSKVKNIRADMKSKNASVLVLTVLDDIAWLLNLRGGDILYNPVFFAYAIVTHDEVKLFANKQKLTSTAAESLSNSDGLHVQLFDYNEFWLYFKQAIESTKGKIWMSSVVSCAVASLVPKIRRLFSATPVAKRKAVKNEIEIAGMKNAHIKDALSLCEFYCWLEETLLMGQEQIYETTCSKKIDELRSFQPHYMGSSFATISGSGSNAAIIHYVPQEGSDKLLSKDQIYLCDTGGQYLDGTTDITRTFHFGTPTDYEKECFTRVVKGVIALSLAKFPKHTLGIRLDSFARSHLWDIGLDYLHGTGHGVGMFLCVHEGPMGISYKNRSDDVGLVEGMILSIEPGYYEEGKFGIRIENLAVVVPAETKKGENYLTFETITLVPIQTKLLDLSLMTEKEIKWINIYHLKCREVIGEKLKEQGKMHIHQWLMKETEPLKYT